MACVFCAAAVGAHAQTFKTLATFDFTNGAGPLGLVQGTDGRFYGPFGNNGGGVFKANPSGGLSEFYAFGAPGPALTIVLGSDSNLYGTNAVAGAEIFKLDAQGSETTLYEFGAVGIWPQGSLVEGLDGDFYGAVGSGYSSNGPGYIFKVTPKGVFTTIYTFCSQPGCSDGYNPNALVLGPDGNFYGTTEIGGLTNGRCNDFSAGGCGTVFKVTPTGTLTTLHSFCASLNCSDGFYPGSWNYDGFNAPGAALALGADGNFYGTTQFGGSAPQGGSASGTIFKITPQGAFTSLYSFVCDNSDQVPCPTGAGPGSPLVQGTDGNFYGTSYFGGNSGSGTVFQITPSGSLSTLYSFCSQSNCTDGANPHAGLIQATNGTFYGTTYGGGDTTSDACGYGNGCGTVFSLNMGFGPFVRPILTMGKVGAKILVLGNHLAGSTAVSFDGVAATAFKVVSSTKMTATVPSGALTGTLSVTTPSGTLNSDGPFYVTPQLITFAPANGEAGIPVTLTGVSLTQASAVSFNGVAAPFTVNSDTQVTATVPAGASTGPITITTAGGAATSRLSFKVR